jgi:zinc transport system substrate-binding protein
MLPQQLFAVEQGEIDVFISIPPQKWLCEQLGGEHLKVSLLIAKGQEPHAFDPSPRQIRALSGADLFFTVGLIFEQELIRRLKTGAPNLQIVDSSKNIEKIPMDTAGHGHSATRDPHVWLSPLNLKSMAEVMAAALVENDPDHEQFYRNNLLSVNDQLDDLDNNIQKKLFPYKGTSFFVFHPAFGYFANRYKLHQVAVETGGKTPTPKQLFALIGKARSTGVKVIFVQPQFDPRSAESVAKGIGGKVVPLDSLAENVVENMESMAEEIVNALKGKKK